jgi:pimeloyl-ACP methyl ester carboxylesterase
VRVARNDPITFVLVPGAGGAAWYWHRVVPELEARGHAAVAIDLPGHDQSAGLPEYADAVVAAAGDHPRVVVVAQSMGGFSAPSACARRAVESLVLLNAMIPRPGETAGEWWDATGAVAAREDAAEAGGWSSEFDPETYFLHDVPAEVVATGAAHVRDEAEVAFGQPFALERWPDVPTRVLAGRDDRFFPLDFQRRVARERLGLDVEEVPGGHLAALAYPLELVEHLLDGAPAS